MKNLTLEETKRRLYDLYKLDWMSSHGYSIDDILERVGEELFNNARDFDAPFEPTFKESVANWEYDRGFDGSLYACFNEFLDCEYRDRAYIISLAGRDFRRDELIRIYLDDTN